MKIAVLIKQTFDTEEKIVIENGRIRDDGAQFILNPYDEYAVEEAIIWRDQLGGDVTVICAGPDRAEDVLRRAIAMGADEAVLIHDPAVCVDEYTVSVALAKTLQKIGFDLILAGNQAVDGGSGQVAVRVAEILEIPHISALVKLEVDGTSVIGYRDADGDTEIVACPLPVLVTAQQGLNEPRYPSLLGIRKANKKEIQHVTSDDLGISKQALEPKVTKLEVFAQAPKSAGFILQGELHEQVNQLVHLLRSSDKIL